MRAPFTAVVLGLLLAGCNDESVPLQHSQTSTGPTSVAQSSTGSTVDERVKFELASSLETKFDVGGVRLGMNEHEALEAARGSMPKATLYSRLRYGRDEIGYRDVGFKLSCEAGSANACHEGGYLEVYAPEGRVISVRREWQPLPKDSYPSGESVMTTLRAKYPGVNFAVEHGDDGGISGYRADVGFMPNNPEPVIECEPFLAVTFPQSPCAAGLAILVRGKSDANSLMRAHSVSIYLADIAAHSRFATAQATASLARSVKPKF